MTTQRNRFFLDEIIFNKKIEVENKKRKIPLEFFFNNKDIKKNIRSNSFLDAISRVSAQTRLKMIAEIKQSSPSKGILKKRFDAVEIAEIYEKHKIDAISVLTEEKYFKGSLNDLKSVSQNCSLPILRKDFIFDDYQIHEAKYFGASAILLIAAILSKKDLIKLLEEAKKIGLYVIVEIHNQKELDRALECEADIIGINNRNLKTFKTDLKICEKLASLIPSEKVIVVESGIKSKNDVLKLRSLPVDAMLIGEAFMTAKDIEKKIDELMLS